MEMKKFDYFFLNVDYYIEMCGFIYMNKYLKNRIFKLVLRQAANEVL